MSNRPEIHLCDTAAIHLGATPFSIYATSTPEQIAHLFGAPFELAATRIPLRGWGSAPSSRPRCGARRGPPGRRAPRGLAQEDPEDVFYLTAAELTAVLPGNAGEVVALRVRRAE